MTTKCYALVRGSALRVTGLTKRGYWEIPPGIIWTLVTKSITKITIIEVAEGGTNETLRNDEDELRIYLPSPAQTIKYTADIEFTKTDPALIYMLTGNPVVVDASGDIVGFDANTRLPVQQFAMEVWSKLSGVACTDDAQQYGYSLFPFLRGGILGGFVFSDGAVSFVLRGAQVQRGSRWGSGPYDLTGEGERLVTPVSGNTRFRQFISPIPPPEPTDGVVYSTDIVDGGSPSSTSSDIIDGGSPSSTTDDILDGGTP